MFKEAIRLAAKRLDSRTFVKDIRQTERQFVNYIPQMDDISLLAIKYIGNLMPGIYHRSILLSNDVQEVPVLSVFISGICEDMHFDKLTRAGVNLAIEEAVVNVMNYAYPKGAKGDIHLTVTAENEIVSFVLRDNGKPFDPTSVEKVDVKAYVERRSMGGLGVHLIRHYMDEVSYEYADGQNVLTMRKKLNKTNN
jgi:sigma-B regulation protein RsbU (phosphoserine phosphatase)